MFSTLLRIVAVVALLAVVAGEGRSQYERRTAIVEAVEKTRNGIVTLKVTKSASWGKKEIVGTGVVIDERGYVVTNHHVVAEASKVVAVLADKTTVTAEVVVEDPKHDLGILRLPVKKKLQALRFAPGSDLMVGEMVIAVGNPFGYSNTVTPGIISALGREITMPSGEVLTNLTQHSASINPGNSGGPLLNVNGELIGINVALREGAQGIGFALNSDTVQRVLSRHLSASKVSRLSHGLDCREQVAPKAKVRQAVVVAAVEARSPAARAGLQTGDVILAVNDRPVTNRFDLERALWDSKAGDKIEAAILREGKQARLAMTLSRPEGTRVTAVSGSSGR